VSDKGVIEHLESFLGPIETGWRHDESGGPLSFDVALFRRGPSADTVSFSTVGLSKHSLRSPRSEKAIHHELVIATKRDFGTRNIPALLQQMGMEAIQRDRAYLRGEVIGPRDDLFRGTDKVALYVSAPSCFPDSFARVVTPDNAIVVFAWLIPITRAEAELVTREGWERFEDTLVSADADLMDFNRNSVEAGTSTR
jgi:hypothetical protein